MPFPSTTRLFPDSASLIPRYAKAGKLKLVIIIRNTLSLVISRGDSRIMEVSIFKKPVDASPNLLISTPSIVPATPDTAASRIISFTILRLIRFSLAPLAR